MLKRAGSVVTKGLAVFICLLMISPTSFAQINVAIQEAYLPEVIHSQGDVQVLQETEKGRGKKWMKAKKGMKIRPGARIKTTKKSQVDLGVVDKYQMRVKEKSDVIAGSLAFNTKSRKMNSEYTIKEGSIYNKIQEDYLGEFEINTENVMVTAIGTEYAVDVWGPQQQTWVGSAVGNLQAVDRYDNVTVDIPKASKLEVGKGEEDSGRVVPLPEYELQDLRRELDKIGSGFDEDLDIRVYFILSYSTNRVREFLNGAALITNTNEPRKLKSLFVPTVQMLPQRRIMAPEIIKNLGKIIFVCNYYNDPRFSPHFLSFAGVIYHMVNKDREAVKVLENVLKQYPKFRYASIVQCAIGILYEDLNQPRQARAAYQKVLRDYPDSLEVEEAENGLDRLGR